ncbi:SDR family NAD(P)-dependent oxidoreductase [Aeromicrobium choanae]|uniref:NADP-dependent 3-hydroxy acid dehydrogenase YdfG n=1 Tax=Aeromicrobium choanae TaxID=1736691 RepID=A0A1T4Z392_9ACTN|nr:SDR family oxidoreductase [Aeromicrobium choanae]SKB08005.1 NADP-dependent 3-hydroxy acid dehydrogenase YdfG [Aeromicrobium choanae]
MPTAVVTGASSGIGEATARALSAAGYTVLAAARRRDRIERLAEEIDAIALPCDITNPDDVARLAEAVGDRLDLLVNNAGGAKGLEDVTEADLDDWRWMYETNVLGTVAVTKALTPALINSGAGTIINVGSTAGRVTYEGGGGYTAAKHALAAVTETLRLELNGQPVRITEIAPGMVRTEEFSLTRFDGDSTRADAVYAGVDEPLLAEDIADAITWVATRPRHVDVDLMVIKPVAQAAQWKVHRRPQ